jgi:hypothetical protein
VPPGDNVHVRFSPCGAMIRIAMTCPVIRTMALVVGHRQFVSRCRIVAAVVVLVGCTIAVALGPVALFAAPVHVQFPEGSAHGFLVLRGTDAKILADGDWWQIPAGDRVEVHLRFRFTDGSLSHEMFELTQRRVWSMVSYRSVQQGPSFPRDIDARINRASGRYRIETKERGKGDSKVDEGRIDLPEDTYALGMLAVLLKSIRPGESMMAHAVAFTPKPRVLKLEVSPDGEEAVTIHGLARKTSRYVAKAELGGALGTVASVAGKQPPPLHYWMAGDPVPTFARFDGPLYPEGPIWRVELAAPDWADDARK